MGKLFQKTEELSLNNVIIGKRKWRNKMTNADKLATEIANLQHKRDCLKRAQTALRLAGYPGDTQKADYYISRSIINIKMSIINTQDTLAALL